MNRNMHAVVTEWSGMFSGTFRNVRTKAECGDTIPVGTTTERVRNVRNVRTKAKCSDTIPAGATTEHVRNVRNIFRNIQECEKSV